MTNFEKFINDPRKKDHIKKLISRGMLCSDCPLNGKTCEGFSSLPRNTDLEDCDKNVSTWLDEEVQA